MSADPRALLRPLLARRLSPAERRQLAAELLALAAEQERLADADERVGHQVRRAEIAQAAARQRTGRPRGSGGSFVRWSTRPGHSGHLHIAARLYDELGRPARLDVQRLGRELHIRPCAGADGWAVTLPTGARGGLARLAIGEASADALRLAEGRWPAEVRAGAIVAELP